MAISAETHREIIQLVVGMFDAAPGATFLPEFISAVESGTTFNALAEDLSKTTYFQELYPDQDTSNSFSTKFIDALVGGEVAESDENWAVGFVEGLLASGVTRAEAMVTTINALANVPTTDGRFCNARIALENKVDVAEYYSKDMLVGYTDLSLLQGLIENVSHTQRSVMESVDLIGPAVVGPKNCYIDDHSRRRCI